MKQLDNRTLLIILIFIALGILTMVTPRDESSSTVTDTEQTDGTLSQYHELDIPEGEDVSDGQLSQSDDSKADDNIQVVEPMETNPYDELNSLIGLTSVKKEVMSLANFTRIQKQRQAKGLRNSSLSYHCVFTGNPGTGKTTIARILARIYKDLGVVSRGHLVECDRADLIAEYEGQTASKTNRVIDKAIGGVLFIDEAYSLLETGNGFNYGSEAIATLLKRMEDNRDSLVVIVAGYPREMKQFIESNPGLESRFTRYLDFPDYTATELADIFLARASKYNYELAPEALRQLQASLSSTVAHKSRNFGNARYVRNVFEQAIVQQANRLSRQHSTPTTSDLQLITAEDLQAAIRSVKP